MFYLIERIIKKNNTDWSEVSKSNVQFLLWVCVSGEDQKLTMEY